MSSTTTNTKGINSSMELANLEMQAKEHAKMIVANHFQRPDQLEKTEQLRKAVARQKGSVEAMLKTAIQSQLDGVKTGLNQLSSALKDVREIENDMKDIKVTYNSIIGLGIKLKNIREENSRHSQLSAACDNVLHIFTVPETINKCKELINEGKLLQAHKNISDLERSRDDILYELHKQSQNASERHLVEQYFSGLNDLVEALAKQLWLILQRTIISVRVEPTIIVTVIRIIEREEKMDELMGKRYDQMQLKGRQKQWRKKAFETMNKTILSRIEGNQMEDRSTNKMWLVRHLEVTRQIVLEDLRVVKTLFELCFPPHYNIVERYIEMYHNAIKAHLDDIVEQGLEGNEIISLLNWVSDYPTKELMGNPDLNIDLSKYEPLLNEENISQLQEQYVVKLRDNIKDWMRKSLKSDVEDWMKDRRPIMDDKEFFSTALPFPVIEMVGQNIIVAKTIGLELKVVFMCLEEIKEFIQSYKAELKSFRDIHLADRQNPPYYLDFIIGNANNCQTFIDFVNQLCRTHMPESDPSRIKPLLDSLRTLTELLCTCLIEEVFSDLDPHIQDFFTRKWMVDKTLIDSICMTISDYFQDFVHAKSLFYNELFKQIRLRIAKEFCKAILARKLLLKNFDERLAAAEKVVKEVNQLNALFSKLKKEDSTKEREDDFDDVSPLDSILDMVELLKMKDKSLIMLELSGFVKKYPDVKADNLVNLLSLRSDLDRNEVRDNIEQCLGEVSKIKRKTIFSLI